MIRNAKKTLYPDLDRWRSCARNGASPSGWTLEDTSGETVAVAAVPTATDRSVKLNDTSTSNAVIARRSFKAPSGKMINGVVSTGARLYGIAPGQSYQKVMGNNVWFTGLYLDGGDYIVGTDPYVPGITDTTATNSVVIRDAPVTGAYVSNNWFYDSNAANEIVQKFGIGHMFVGTNKYGTGSGIQYLTNVYTSP